MSSSYHSLTGGALSSIAELFLISGHPVAKGADGDNSVFSQESIHWATGEELTN